MVARTVPARTVPASSPPDPLGEPGCASRAALVYELLEAAHSVIEQRADILLVARIAGHKDPNVTLRVYAHLMNERVSEAADLYDPLKEALWRRNTPRDE